MRLKSLWYLLTHARIILEDLNNIIATLDCANMDGLPVGKIWDEICDE